MPLFPFPHDISEEQETLIHFFGLENLLNIQTPIFYNPGQKGFDIYRSLPEKQDFFSKFRKVCVSLSPNLHMAVKNWVSIVASQYRKSFDLGNTFSTNNTPTFSENYLNTIFSQDMPQNVLQGDRVKLLQLLAPKSLLLLLKNAIDILVQLDRTKLYAIIFHDCSRIS